MTKEKAKQTRKSTVGRTMHYYWQELVKHKWYALGCTLITPIIIFFRSIFGAMIFANIIDQISSGVNFEEDWPMLVGEGVLFLVLYIISSMVLEKLRLYWCWKMELLSMRDLSMKCFDVVSEQSMQFHNDRFSGSLVSQTNKFVGAFERLFDTFLWDAWPVLCYFVFVLIILGAQVPWYVLGLVVLVAIYTVMSWLTMGRIAYLNDESAKADAKQTGQLADSISNITSVKSYANEAHEHARFADFVQKNYKASMTLMRATIKRDLLFGMVHVALMTLLAVFLIFGNHWLGISVTTLILIVNYTNGILSDLWNITHIFKNVNRVFGDAHEMTLILDTADDVVDAPNAVPLELKTPSVEFNNIAFKHYDAKAPIFENFSLTVQPGERIGLVGVSGSGKTTLTKLLLRFADVNGGEILISGQDIRDITQESLRKNIAYVPQETALFHRSIAENIAYGKPNATAEEIQRAAKLANAHDFIMELPEGYDTLVGERGVKLSGGQRQRVAIARAILKDAPILVLDEATSALDSESEALIQDALNTLMKDRTSIVIAHRLSTVANLDRIIVLEDGEIAEQGRHQDLLKKPDGAYHRLWSRQSGAFMKD